MKKYQIRISLNFNICIFNGSLFECRKNIGNEKKLKICVVTCSEINMTLESIINYLLNSIVTESVKLLNIYINKMNILFQTNAFISG